MEMKPIIGLAVACILLCSCQSKSFQINGFANKFQDGDTICLSMEDHYLSAQTTVNDGKFQFFGETDSIRLCTAFVKKEPGCRVTFFLEPGHITIEILPHPDMSRVSGTVINNEWQELSDSIGLLAQEIVNYFKVSLQDSVTQKRVASSIDSLHQCMSSCILHKAQQNSDNALGQYIRENYKGPEFK